MFEGILHDDAQVVGLEERLQDELAAIGRWADSEAMMVSCPGEKGLD
jgi:hypothetical protein